MTLSREDLAARLLPLLSLTEGRGCVELLTLAGLPRKRGAAQTAAVVLHELVTKGLARHVARGTSSPGANALFFAVEKSAGPQAETVELPELDAVLTFTITTGRPFGAPTDRTTLALSLIHI